MPGETIHKLTELRQLPAPRFRVCGGATAINYYRRLQHALTYAAELIGSAADNIGEITVEQRDDDTGFWTTLRSFGVPIRTAEQVTAAARDAWRPQRNNERDEWIRACGETEQSFRTQTGRRLLYCWNPARQAHAYLDCETDTILTTEEAFEALALFS